MVRTEVWLVCNVGVCVLVGDMLGASCVRFGASTYFLYLFVSFSTTLFWSVIMTVLSTYYLKEKLLSSCHFRGLCLGGASTGFLLSLMRGSVV